MALKMLSASDEALSLRASFQLSGLPAAEGLFSGGYEMSPVASFLGSSLLLHASQWPTNALARVARWKALASGLSHFLDTALTACSASVYWSTRRLRSPRVSSERSSR